MSNGRYIDYIGHGRYSVYSLFAVLSYTKRRVSAAKNNMVWRCGGMDWRHEKQQ